MLNLDARGRTQVFEGRPTAAGRNGWAGPGQSRAISPLRAGRDGALGPNILIISAPCLPAHQVRVRGNAGVLELCFFVCLLDGCLQNDDYPIANLEPGVSAEELLTSYRHSGLKAPPQT